MSSETEIFDQKIICAPEHVTQTESLIREAIQLFQIQRHPELSAKQIDFLCHPWVHFFTHSALHRLEVQCESSIINSSDNILANLESDFPVPGDTLSFMEFSRTPAYRIYLDESLAGHKTRPTTRTSMHILHQNMPKQVSTVAFMSCLPRRIRYLLPIFSLGKIRFLENKTDELEIPIDPLLRIKFGKFIEKILAKEGLQKASWLAARVIELFPRSLLENLHDNLLNKKKDFPRKILYSANGWQLIDDWKIYAISQKLIHKAHWIGTPHAMSHGSLAIYWQRDFEIFHMDTYLTWGWSHNKSKNRNTVPFYSPYFAGQKRYKPRNLFSDNSILISAAARPQHLLEYPYTPERFENYLKTQLRLAAEVNKITRISTVIRTRPNDLGWNMEAMISSLKNTEITLEFQKGKFTDRLKKSRLHICDNCSTTIIDSLWENHPTLVMITDEYFQISPFSHEEYHELISAGIFHTTAESLLNQLKIIEHKIEFWWNGKDTQKAINLFLNRQARHGSGLLTWHKALSRPETI